MNKNKSVITLFLVFVLLIAGSVQIYSTENSAEKASVHNGISLPFQKQSTHFIFYGSNSLSNIIDSTSKILEHYYDRITKDLGVSFEDKIKVNVYSDSKALEKATDKEISDGGFSDDKEIYIVNPSANNYIKWSYNDKLKVSVRAFVNIVLRKLTKNELPLWLDAGVTHYESRLEPMEPFIINFVNKPEKLPSIKDIFEADGSSSLNGFCLYCTSYTIIDYLVKSYGYDKLISYIKDPKDFKNTFGVTIDKFNSDWKAYVNNYNFDF